MTRKTSSPITLLAIAVVAVALFAVAGLFATNAVRATPVAADSAAGPMTDFTDLIDCNDGFWEVVCASANAEPGDDAETALTDDEPPIGEPVIVEEARRIDNDPTCVTLENGNLFCHS